MLQTTSKALRDLSQDLAPLDDMHKTLRIVCDNFQVFCQILPQRSLRIQRLVLLSWFNEGFIAAESYTLGYHSIERFRIFFLLTVSHQSSLLHFGLESLSPSSDLGSGAVRNVFYWFQSGYSRTRQGLPECVEIFDSGFLHWFVANRHRIRNCLVPINLSLVEMILVPIPSWSSGSLSRFYMPILTRFKFINLIFFSLDWTVANQKIRSTLTFIYKYFLKTGFGTFSKRLFNWFPLIFKRIARYWLTEVLWIYKSNTTTSYSFQMLVPSL